MTTLLISCQQRSVDYWVGDTLWDETSTSSGIDSVIINIMHQRLKSTKTHSMD